MSILISGIAYAAGQFYKTMTAQFVITVSGPSPPTAGELRIYADSGLTQEITNMNFGSLEAGQSKAVTIYLKNNSISTLTGVVASSDLANSKGTISGLAGSIPPGGSINLPLTLNTKVGATSTSGITITLAVGY